MKLNTQKSIAAKAFKVSPKRVKLDPARADEIKEAITKSDIKGLLGTGALKINQKKGSSRARANKILKQKAKGQQKGRGSRKGKQTTYTPKKETWMRKVRAQRGFLKELKEKELINTQTFTDLYRKSKGGFFRSKNHIKLYIDEHRLINKED